MGFFPSYTALIWLYLSIQTPARVVFMNFMHLFDHFEVKMARDNWSGSFFLLRFSTDNTLFNMCNSLDHRKTLSKNNIANVNFIVKYQMPSIMLSCILAMFFQLFPLRKMSEMFCHFSTALPKQCDLVPRVSCCPYFRHLPCTSGPSCLNPGQR